MPLNVSSENLGIENYQMNGMEEQDHWFGQNDPWYHTFRFLFFAWDYNKYAVYNRKPETLEDLKNFIEEKVGSSTTEMCQIKFQNVVNACRFALTMM